MVSERMSLEQFSVRLDGQARKAAQGDFRTAFAAIKLMIVADVQDNFQKSHGPDGTGWPALAHPRANSHGGDKPLLDNGLLRASLVSQAQGHVERMTADSLEVGTNLHYAALHQYGHPGIVPTKAKFLCIPLTPEAVRAGSPRNFPGIKFRFPFILDAQDKRQYVMTKGPVKIPKRPFLGFSEKLMKNIERRIAEEVTRGL